MAGNLLSSSGGLLSSSLRSSSFFLSTSSSSLLVSSSSLSAASSSLRFLTPTSSLAGAFGAFSLTSVRFRRKPKRKFEVVLREDFPLLGQAGETVTVKRGYARNFLVPRHIADYTPPNYMIRVDPLWRAGGAGSNMDSSTEAVSEEKKAELEWKRYKRRIASLQLVFQRPTVSPGSRQCKAPVTVQKVVNAFFRNEGLSFIDAAHILFPGGRFGQGHEQPPLATYGQHVIYVRLFKNVLDSLKTVAPLPTPVASSAAASAHKEKPAVATASPEESSFATASATDESKHVNPVDAAKETQEKEKEEVAKKAAAAAGGGVKANRVVSTEELSRMQEACGGAEYVVAIPVTVCRTHSLLHRGKDGNAVPHAGEGSAVKEGEEAKRKSGKKKEVGNKALAAGAHSPIGAATLQVIQQSLSSRAATVKEEDNKTKVNQKKGNQGVDGRAKKGADKKKADKKGAAGNEE